ncbi:MAG TPA: hypothetical protein VMT30_06360 [Candidatus Saccharimonadia bacterium]|nr:hypothetical protein [Candidatus Saccharimonadia bacterium]
MDIGTYTFIIWLLLPGLSILSIYCATISQVKLVPYFVTVGLTLITLIGLGMQDGFGLDYWQAGTTVLGWLSVGISSVMVLAKKFRVPRK